MPSIDVNDVLKRTQGTGDGSNVSFSFAFQVNNTNEIKVYEDSTLKSEGVHYDIVDSSNNAGLNSNGTGVVKFKTSPTDYTPANGKKITILSVMSLARSSVYTTGGNITAGSLETDFDRLHRIAGDFKEVKSRTLVAPEHDATDINMTLPKEADRANSFLYFNSDGNPTVTSLITTLSVGTGVVFEGSTADEFETTLTVADPSGSDKTITLPNATGTVSLLTNTETLTNKTLTSPVLNTGVSGTAIKDEDNMSSNSATHLATQQSIKAYVDSQVSASDLDLKGDDDVALSIDLDSDVLDIAGGDGIDTSGSSTTLTVAIDNTVVTKAGTQTLTNKTLERPTMSTGTSGGFGDSVLIGFNAGGNAGSSHRYNVAIGYEAFAQMGSFATNNNNVALGYYALHDDSNSSSSSNNVAIGNSALKFVDGALSNIAIGYQSLMTANSSNKLEGDYNIAIGHEAGKVISGMNPIGVKTGSGNILIGYEANTSSLSASNELVIKTYDGTDAVTYLTGSASGTTGTITIPGNLTVNGLITGTATTQSASDNSTKIATTAYTDTAISNLVDTAPGTLNTLNELASALGDDENFSTTVTNSIATKMPLAGGTFTGDVTLTGDNYNVVWDKSDDALEFADNAKLTFGDDADLEIRHNGSHSQIKDVGTGKLQICGSAVQINNAGNTESMITASQNGAVTLYHDNVGRFETTSSGVTITSTDAGADADPSLILYRNSASPDDLDYMGQMFFKGRNWDGSATVHDVDYAKIMAKATDVTDGTEDGNLEFYVSSNGNPSSRLVLKGNGNTAFNNKNVILGANVDLLFDGSTGGGSKTTLTATDPTQDNTLTLPDASGTVATTSKAIALAMLFG